MRTEEEASKRACEILKNHFIAVNHPNVDVYDDNYVINNYPDEWSWYMQGWRENIPMNKTQFVEFLRKQEEEREFLCHWAKTASNSDDFWHLYRPAVDWLEDDMDLSHEGVVKISYNKSLGDNNSSKEFLTTYDDFVKNYVSIMKII